MKLQANSLQQQGLHVGAPLKSVPHPFTVNQHVQKPYTSMD